jgi:uncharacterized ubiquitin-like protein YukD
VVSGEMKLRLRLSKKTKKLIKLGKLKKKTIEKPNREKKPIRIFKKPTGSVL